MTILRAGRLGVPFPGSLERLGGPARPVQSILCWENEEGQELCGRRPGVQVARANWAARVRRDYPFTASHSRGQIPTEDGTIAPTIGFDGT